VGFWAILDILALPWLGTFPGCDPALLNSVHAFAQDPARGIHPGLLGWAGHRAAGRTPALYRLGGLRKRVCRGGLFSRSAAKEALAILNNLMALHARRHGASGHALPLVLGPAAGNKVSGRARPFFPRHLRADLWRRLFAALCFGTFIGWEAAPSFVAGADCSSGVGLHRLGDTKRIVASDAVDGRATLAAIGLRLRRLVDPWGQTGPWSKVAGRAARVGPRAPSPTRCVAQGTRRGQPSA